MPKEGLEAPLLSADGGSGVWDKACSRLGLSRRAAFRLAVVSALLAGILLGACCSAAALGLLGRLSHWRASWLPPAMAPPVRTVIEVHGRKVTVFTPSVAATHPERPVPAVIVLHGSYDSPTAIEQASGFSAAAEASSQGFLAVYPAMATPGGVSWGFELPWETAFFQALVDKLVAEFSARRQRVFVCGHSNGGTMALFLQNNMADVFQAGAAVEAGIGHLEAFNNRSTGRPTMLVWNHNDPVLKEFGGEELYRKTLAKIRRHDPLNRGPSSMQPLNAGTGERVVYAERLTWKPTPVQPQTVVVSWSSEVPTHDWVNPTNIPGSAIDAARQIWEFFQATESYPHSGALRGGGGGFVAASSSAASQPMGRS